MKHFISLLFSILLLVFVMSDLPAEAKSGSLDNVTVGMPYRLQHQIVPTILTGSMNTLKLHSPVIESLQITSPSSYQAFQKNKNNRKNITITGTYVGNPRSITASFNSGKAQVISASPSGGGFSGVLKNQRAGQGELKVWFTNDPTRVSIQKKVAITDIYVLIGQSNQTEVETKSPVRTPKTYSMPPGMGPVVFNANSKRAAWNDAAMNSTYVVQFGQDYYSKHGYPCAFVFAAIGGTNLSKWQPNSTYAYKPGGEANDYYGVGLNLYQRAKSMVQVAAPAGVKAFLWHQGEADAGTKHISADLEKIELQAIASRLNSDFSGAPMLVAKLQTIRTSLGLPIDTSTVRQGQVSAWGSMQNLMRGPDLSDLEADYEPFLGSFHLLNDDSVMTVGHRWFKACRVAGVA